MKEGIGCKRGMGIYGGGWVAFFFIDRQTGQGGEVRAGGREEGRGGGR